MTPRERQEAEIKTIKPRQITIKLSDADVDRITLQAAKCGMTTAELLENYIGDLVGGTHSNGSDERELARQYLERCGFDVWNESTFLYSLIEGDFLDIICDNIAFIAENADDSDPVTQLEVKEAQAEIETYYSCYVESFKSGAEPLEKGLEAVKRYMQDRAALLTDADPFIAYLNAVYSTLKHEKETGNSAADEKIQLLKAVKAAYKQIREGAQHE